MPLALRATHDLLGPTITAPEVAQALRERLFLMPAGGATRIGRYDGSVPLQAWVRVIARRCAYNLRDARPHWAEEIAGSLVHIPEFASPEAQLAREGFRDQLRRAFVDAVKGLGQRERAVLRMHVAEGLALDEVAAAYGVHRATAYRWMATAHATVLSKTREALERQLGPSSPDLDSLLRSAMSGLDLGISGIFKEPVSSTG